MMCNRIYERVKDLENPDFADVEAEAAEEQIESQQLIRGGRRRRDDRLKDLVQVLVFHELFRRRRDHRNNRRRFY